MAYEKRVIIEWADNRGEHLLTTVSIDEDWNSIDDSDEVDENIVFYFANERDYQEAFAPFEKQKGDLEFRIVREAE